MNCLNKIVPMCIQLITFPYVSRVLLSEGVGKVNYVLSILSYFQLAAAFGVVAYAIVEGSKIRDDRKKLNKFATEIFSLNMITTLIAYSAFVILLQFQAIENYKHLLLTGSVLIWETLFSVMWIFNIVEDYTYITVRGLVFQILSAIAIFVFVKSPDDINNYMYISAIRTVIGCIINFAYSRRFVKLFSEKIDLSMFRHFKPMLVIFMLDIFNSIFLNVDVTMLGYIKGDYAVGIYSNAVKISKIICSFISVLSTVLMPRISYYVKKGYKEEYEKLINKAINFMMLISIPAIIGFILYSREIILISCGKDFIDSIPVSKVLALTLFFMPINGFIAWQVFIPFNKQNVSLIVAVIGAIINVVLNAVLIPLFSFNAAAFTTIISEFIVLLLLIHFSRDLIKWKIVMKDVWQYLLAGTSILFIWVLYTFALKHIADSLWLFIPTVLVSSIAYFAVLLLLKNVYVVEELRKFLRKQ